MKVTVSSVESARKLMAVSGWAGACLWIRDKDHTHRSTAVTYEGLTKGTYSSLELLLQEDSGRTPIYEGDSVTLTF